MTARDALLHVLYGTRPMDLDDVEQPPSREGDTDAILTLHSHESATLIRAHTAADYAHVLSAYGYAYANGWKSGRDRAAELIEEVTD